MKIISLITALLISLISFGQIEQNINKTSGTVSNPIAEIDSIRFNAGQTVMEVVFTNGNVESHTIADIDEVTFSGDFVGVIAALDCADAAITGTLIDGITASGVSAEIAYTGGNGGPYSSQMVNSTGVTGLTAELATGNFAVGAGSLLYAVNGTPSGSGTASFSIEIGGETCSLEIPVDEEDPYPLGTVHCGNPTVIVDVTNPTTGDTWMDRNLGADQVATSSTDQAAYGDLYQWGRFADGHQCRTSPTTSTLSSTDQPGHGDFITSNSGANWDWRSPQNTNLWQGVNGVNNPCPNGYRLPTAAEWENERASWTSSNAAGAFDSPLKFSMGGFRYYHNASIDYVGESGNYWSSNAGTENSYFFFFTPWSDGSAAYFRAYGFSVRCIKD
jgi:uncharacterized protein (TIGR02145 family)